MMSYTPLGANPMKQVKSFRNLEMMRLHSIYY